MQNGAKVYEPRWVVGLTAVALLMLGSRWGAYLTPVQPIYPAMLLFVLGAAHYLMSHATLGGPALDPEERPRVQLLVCLLIWVLIRFIVGWQISLDALRDFVPYFYVVAGLLAAHATRRSSPQAREKTVRVMVGALTIHALWYALVGIYPQLPDHLPALSDHVNVLTSRPDVDSTLSGILAAYLVAQVVTGRSKHSFGATLLICVCYAGVTLGHSRAGLLAAFIALLFGMLVALKAGGVKPRQMTFLGIVPLLVVAVAMFLPQTTVGQRLNGTFEGQSAFGVAAGAAATTHAREDAWRNLYDWITEDTGRTAFGVGFGPNFMTDSHTTVLLVGSDSSDADSLRSPHDYWLGTFARLGIIGAVLTLLATLVAARRAWRSRAVASERPMLLLASLAVLGFLLPATVGVVLETPFGALPFWWSVGVLAALVRKPPPGSDAEPLAPVADVRPLRPLCQRH